MKARVKRISSAYCDWYYAYLAPLSLLFFSYVIVNEIQSSRSEWPIVAVIFFMLSLALPSGYLIWHIMTYKAVHLKQDGVQVSVYFWRTQIPFTEIESISKRNPFHIPNEIVTITLKEKTNFGKCIRFLAPQRWGRNTPSPVVEELRKSWQAASVENQRDV